MTIDRRRLIQGAGVTALAASGVTALASCSSNSGPTNDEQNNERVKLPAYVPYAGVPTDLPAVDGVPPAFLKFPESPISFAEDKIGDGGVVTAMLSGNSAPLVALPKNRFWQEINKRLGIDLKLDVPPSGADYQAKFSATLAGGDLPDIMNVIPSQTSRIADVLSAQFQDLTEFLAGDAVKEYPALANMPSEAWQGTVYNGGIYGWPYPQATCGNSLVVRDDLREKVGATGEITSGEDFLELCRTLTDAKNNRWAASGPVALIGFFQEMLGAPNEWRIEGGRFTSTYETEETKKAIDLVRQMWADGLIFPDAFSTKLSPYRTLPTGRIAMIYGGWLQWGATMRDNVPLDPNYKASAIAPPKFEGGGLAQKHLVQPLSVIVAMKKTADKERIRQLLRIANWFAAPFGTEEFQFCRFGLPDYHFTVKSGAPTLTEAGTREVGGLPRDFIGSSGSIVIWQPAGMTDVLRATYEYQKKVVPTGVKHPLTGLYSETDSKSRASLLKKIQDLQSDIIQGRKPLSAWDEGVATWRKDGGDAIRNEYQDSYQRAGK